MIVGYNLHPLDSHTMHILNFMEHPSGPVPGVGKAWTGKTYRQTGDAGGRPADPFGTSQYRLVGCTCYVQTSNEEWTDQVSHQGVPSYPLVCHPTSLPWSLVQDCETQERHKKENHSAIP